MYFVVYSPKDYNEVVVQRVMEKFKCVLVVVEYGTTGSHRHCNFIIDDVTVFNNFPTIKKATA